MWARRTQHVSDMASDECGCFLRYLHRRQPLVKPSNGFDGSPSGGREPSRRDGGMAWRESVTATSPAIVVKYVCTPLRQVNLRRGVGLYDTRYPVRRICACQAAEYVDELRGHPAGTQGRQ
jgi:hypothetical protein